ncbi:cytosol aminopeptidase [Campylobacterota bacterium]|nr:cytosol aminopeptidase [Campylobacterota bacterium]
MKLQITQKPIGETEAEITIVFVCAKNLTHEWIKHSQMLELSGFDGEGDGAALFAESKVLYVAVEDTSDLESFRIAATKAIVALRSTKYKTAAVACYDRADETAVSEAIAYGFLLGAYEFNRYKSKSKPLTLSTITFGTDNYYGEKSAAIDEIIAKVEIVAEAVNFARDLINQTPDEMTPTHLASEAQKIASDKRIECNIYDEKYLSAHKMGAFLAVSRASAHPPRLIHLRYTPKKAVKTVVLVGKGLTYDSGGLSLKPSDYMTTMKADMSGAAAVIATISAAAKLQLPIAIHAVIGATENMIGGNAYKPDDVLIAKNGKTIEVRNTDAEGRLVLSDCLCFAQEKAGEFDAILDLATLTGACVVALGEYTSGVMGFNEPLKDALVKAAEKSGELAAKLPFNRHLKKLIKSEIADMTNAASTRYGGAITAALFLGEFIEESNRDKWAHLDIAGPAYVEKAWGINPHGASGAGVRWLIKYLEGLC